MTETERAKVGHALDLLRDSLAEYVDAAMTTEYGVQWDERVAEEDAKRRSNGRKFQVSKGDLAVMLKVIQHERIAPWSNSKTNSDPRIRSFASEMLTLRNLFSHGDECLDEHARLRDTAGRFLKLLGLPIPHGLQVSDDAQRDKSSSVQMMAASGPITMINALVADELTRLGGSGDDVQQLLDRVETVRKVFYREVLESLDPDPESAEAELVEKALPGLLSYTLNRPVGAEVLEILDELARLEDTANKHGSDVLGVLVLFIRCQLLALPEGLALPSLAFDAINHPSFTAGSEEQKADREARQAETRKAASQREMLTKLIPLAGAKGWHELISLAATLKDRSMSNAMIFLGKGGVIADPTTSDEEAVGLVRDCTQISRMFAAMEPGAQWETWLVGLLRLEGRLCNDLGRPEEATQAFARADEIIDRYPGADPNLDPL